MSKKVELKPTISNEIQRKKLASSIMKNAVHVGTKTIAWVPTELLNIKEYQRNRQRHVTQIAENWNDAKCNVLLVSYDEELGCFNVVDGQHRAAAARMRGVEYLVCEIFTGMTISKEAAMFVDWNTTSKKLTPFDAYNANQFISGDEETELSQTDKSIAEICKNYNIKVAKTNSSGTLKSVPVARRIVKRDGIEGLSFVLSIIQKSHWDNYSNGYGSDLMSALSKIYFNHKHELNTVKERLCGFFSQSNPNELEALGNNNYPNLTRVARLDAILAEIIKEPEKPKPVKKKVSKVA